jgi:hypothetical protein
MMVGDSVLRNLGPEEADMIVESFWGLKPNSYTQ